MRTLTLAILLAMAPALGCVATNSSQGGPSASSRNRITLEELATLPPGTAQDAVQALHRDWLRSRSSTLSTGSGRTEPEVFVDGIRMGSLTTLNTIGIETIQEIRYLSPSDATTRYGTGYVGGIIEVIIKKGPTP